MGKGQADPGDGAAGAGQPEAVRACQYSADELLGLTIRELTHPDEAGRQPTAVPGAGGGEVDQYAVEKRYLRKGGEVVWVR